MIPIVTCENPDPHDGHSAKRSVKKICLGKTNCGMEMHEPHEYDAEEDVWCTGICNCGLRAIKHGPGAHK
jgi:hypothetical protein